MANDAITIIQHKRGPSTLLPKLEVAEFAFTTDDKKIYIGSEEGNIEIAKASVIHELITSSEESLRTEIESVKDDMQTARGEVTSVKNDVSSFKSEIDAAKNDIVSAKTEIQSFKGTTAETQAEIVSIKADVASIREDVDSLNELVQSGGSVEPIDLSGIEDTANTALTKAETAIEKADTALETASGFSDKIKSAEGNANVAVKKAEEAINTANDSADDADAALTKANAAFSKSEEAVVKSNTAVSKADAAEAKAATAITNAGAATVKAEEAISAIATEKLAIETSLGKRIDSLAEAGAATNATLTATNATLSTTNSALANTQSTLNGVVNRLNTTEHVHENKVVIDQLEDAEGALSYRGQALGAVYYQSVETVADRDAIPMSQRNEGMMVLVREDGSSYYLKGGVDNAFWNIFSVGAGGATTASTLSANPTGKLEGTNVQSLIDELEKEKLSIADGYTKAEVDQKFDIFTVDYSTLSNLPDLSSLHKHENQLTLNLFSQYRGELTWNGKTFGNMVADIYDKDKDGIIDEAATLTGLTVNASDLNHTKGLTGNIQQQINAITTGTIFKGEFKTYEELITTYIPSKSDWVFVVADETKQGARTQYYHDGADWIYGGGAGNTPSATSTTIGGIKLGGDLASANSTADAPQLIPTGVAEGLYTNPKLLIDAKGRVLHAEEGEATAINDIIISEEETWSSQRINDELFTKASKDHSHDQLHDPEMIGDTRLDTSTKQNNYVVTYNAQTAKAEWKKSQGGKVLVGSKYVEGDYTLIAGSYMNLFIDETAKTITINSTFRDGVANGVPTLTEITETVLVPAGETVRFSLDASFNKYMVNVIRVNNTENNTMDVMIFEQAEGGEYEYLSNKSQKIHDILYLPIADLDNTKKVHVALTNYGTTPTYANLKIKTTNLV